MKKTMKIYAETKIGSIIRKYMDLRGVSMHGLAKEVGVSAEAIRKLANGKSVSTYFEKEIRRALEIPEGEFWDVPSPEAGGQPKRIQNEVHYFRLRGKPRVKASKREDFMDMFSGGDSDGRVMIGVHVVEGLKLGPDAYAIQVPDDSMLPGVKKGDIMIANVDKNPLKDDFVIVEYKHGDKLVAIVRRYLDTKNGFLWLYRTNPMLEEQIKESQVVRVIFTQAAKMVG